MQENQHIEQILESGKTLKEVDPNPYLFNKVLFKLKDKATETYHTNPKLVWVSMSVLTLFIAVNIYMLTVGKSSQQSNDLNAVVDAYGLNNQEGLNYE